MLQLIKKLFSKEKPKQKAPEVEKKNYVASFNSRAEDALRLMNLEENIARTIHPPLKEHMRAGTYAMDSSAQLAFKLPFENTMMSQNVLAWYVSQGFIGYQNAAMLNQHWLISKACLMPAQDAMRKGYEITSNDGEEIESEILDAMRTSDITYNINHNLVELIQMGRVFGIRIAMFVVDSTDKDYYAKPFNLDGITPRSYKGISQIDPYWITPQLDDEAAGDPGSIHFYEPTWWRVSGKLVHRSHLVIYRTEEVADILKPSYLYGGIPIPQKIYERVYAAERTANEAPMLAMTKRTDVIKTDAAQALANQGEFERYMDVYVRNRDNYGVKIIDNNDDMVRLDTSLAELDSVIMTQFQLVSAASNVPSTKLMGTSPKGFQSKGEYEVSNYHEFLESLQETGMTAMVERHHAIVMRSDIMPEFGLTEPLETCIHWNKLDAMTEEQQAEVNKKKAETGKSLIDAGAIDGMDERKRIISDPTSGYNGLIDEEMPADAGAVESEGGELEDA